MSPRPPQDEGSHLKIRVKDGVRYEIPQLQDVSHGGAKRLKAMVLVDPHYDREVLREIIREATRRVAGLHIVAANMSESLGSFVCTRRMALLCR